MLLRAARVAEAAGRASGTRASGAGGACSASAAACETRSGVRPRAGAGTRRWVSGEAARGGESASDAAARPASSSAASSAASPEALVRAGGSLEFGQAAELVFAANRTGRLGWDWHAWHLAASLVPAGVAYAWAQHILASDPEIKRMVEEGRNPPASVGASAERTESANAARDGGAVAAAEGTAALDDVRRRLTRLEHAMADRARGDDAGVEPRVRGKQNPPRDCLPRAGESVGARTGVVAEERAEKAPLADPRAPDAHSRWRALRRRARRFASRAFGARRRGSDDGER